MNMCKVAVPSDNPGGLEAARADHFGHCQVFTIVEVEDGAVKQVKTLDNPPHEHGGCLAPVGLLQEAGVDRILVGGLGRRPLTGFQEAGIKVHFAGGYPTVGDSVNALLNGLLPLFGTESVCGNCG